MTVPERVGVYGGGRMGAGIAHAFLAAGSEVIVVENNPASADAARERIQRILTRAASTPVVPSDAPADPAAPATETAGFATGYAGRSAGRGAGQGPVQSAGQSAAGTADRAAGSAAEVKVADAAAVPEAEVGVADTAAVPSAGVGVADTAGVGAADTARVGVADTHAVSAAEAGVAHAAAVPAAGIGAADATGIGATDTAEVGAADRAEVGVADTHAIPAAGVGVADAAAVAAAGIEAADTAGIGVADTAGVGVADTASVRVQVTTDPAELAGCEVVIEAVPEDAALKAEVLAIAATNAPGAVLASNTSSLSIDGLAAGLAAPDRFLGLHFFNPVPVSSLVEIVVGSRTAAALVADAETWVRALGKTPITVNDSPGFASSRLGVHLALEAMRMLEEGVASAADIDAAMTLGYRHPVGPLRTTDLVGLDVRLAVAEHLAREIGPRFKPPQILRMLVAQGHLGRKTGKGFYEW